jgi:predicted metal-dependent phosphotriesterase family hydrolase
MAKWRRNSIEISRAFARQLKANQGAGPGSAVVVFVPKMRYTGVKEETIQKIVVDNPRRA